MAAKGWLRFPLVTSPLRSARRVAATMVDHARASLLATLAADRERRQQLDTAPDSAAKRKQERDALIERLLQERRERQEREQALPPSAADGVPRSGAKRAIERRPHPARRHHQDRQ